MLNNVSYDMFFENFFTPLSTQIVEHFNLLFDELQNPRVRQSVMNGDASLLNARSFEEIVALGLNMVEYQSAFLEILNYGMAHFYRNTYEYNEDGEVLSHGNWDMITNRENDWILRFQKAMEKCYRATPLPFLKQLLIIDNIIREDYGDELSILIDLCV